MVIVTPHPTKEDVFQLVDTAMTIVDEAHVICTGSLDDVLEYREEM